jgi:hypothetical protein
MVPYVSRATRYLTLAPPELRSYPTLPYHHTHSQTNVTISLFKLKFSSLRRLTANMVTRKPSHAGAWYTANRKQLSQQLDGWLEAVPDSTTPIGTASSEEGEVSIPTPDARAIIGP